MDPNYRYFRAASQHLPRRYFSLRCRIRSKTWAVACNLFGELRTNRVAVFDALPASASLLAGSAAFVALVT
jgi:hypothetical protein